jgi:cytochrome b561
VGITILALAVLRVLWRFIDRPPPPEPGPAWQRVLATATHVLMYVLLLSMPLSGWAMSSAAHFPVSWFGLFQLPDLTAPSEALKHTLERVHGLQANALFTLASLHVLAALKHHFVDRDGVLLRMFGRTRSTG